jgi:hypothetical protein
MICCLISGPTTKQETKKKVVANITGRNMSKLFCLCLGRRVLIRASRFIGGGSTDLSCFALLFFKPHLISQHNSKRQKRKFKVDSTLQFDKTSKASIFSLDSILFGLWLNCCVMSSRPASLNDLMMSQLRQPAVWHIILGG